MAVDGGLWLRLAVARWLDGWVGGGVGPVGGGLKPVLNWANVCSRT